MAKTICLFVLFPKKHIPSINKGNYTGWRSKVLLARSQDAGGLTPAESENDGSGIFDRHPVFQSFSSGKREADKANEAAPGWRPATRTMLSAPAFTSKKRKSFVNRWYQSVWAFIYSPRFISAENALCAI